MTAFFANLQQRKLVQWAIAYCAGAWVVLQVLGLAADSYDWPHRVMQIAFACIALGFLVTLVLAWYHGERGAQRVTSTELVILTLLLAIGGGLMWRFGPQKSANAPAAGAASANPAANGPVASAAPAPASPIPAKSIAVLPFVNMSGDAKNDYFSDGITEEILDALAQVPNLKVAARTSAFAFKGKAEDLRKVGEVLGVASVLEGSVQQAGDEVRITAQLIDTRTGYHLWSEKYDRKLTSIFAVEDEISKAITDKLQVQWSGAAQQAVDPRAHDFYLRGLTLLAARAVSEAVGAFQQAVTLDPKYAQAWAALAEAQALLPGYGPTPPRLAYGDSLESARRALALDPNIALAHVAQGMVYSNQMHWADADHAFRQALALAPGDAETLNQYAQFLNSVGQLGPALAVFDRALARDPLSGISGAIRVQLRFQLGLDDAAAADAQIRRIVAAHPESLFVHRAALNIYLALHRYADAEIQARAAAALNGQDPEVPVQLIRGIADPAQRARAVQVLESPAGAALRRDAFVHAHWLVQLSERERAIAVLEGSTDDGAAVIPQLLWIHDFDPVRTDPRFKAALKKIGLPYTPGSMP